MDCRSAWMLAIGGWLALAAGCAITPCGDACETDCEPGLGRRCSDCVPPWVPARKYKPCVDDMVVRYRGKSCGYRALARYRRESGERPSADFSAGFVQAHVDLAEGRGPLPPSVPPSRYWAAYYRSCAGQPKVEEWFAGYQVGLDIGLQGGVSQFRRIDVRSAGCPSVTSSAMPPGAVGTIEPGF